MNESGAVPNSAAQRTEKERTGFLMAKVENAIEQVKQNRNLNRRRASWIKVLTLALSSGATILLGLQITNTQTGLKDMAFIFSACVTLLSALEPFFNFRALWIEHESALSRFHRFKDELEFYLAGLEPEQLSEQKLQEFHDKYQEIWEELSLAWIHHRRKEPF